MYSSLFPRDLFAEVERLQREMQQAFDPVSPSIRGFARGYPALNVGSTLMLGILAGSKRYAHIAGVRGDAVAAKAFGLRGHGQRRLGAPRAGGDGAGGQRAVDAQRADGQRARGAGPAVGAGHGRHDQAAVRPPGRCRDWLQPAQAGPPQPRAAHLLGRQPAPGAGRAVLSSGKQHTSGHAKAAMARLLDELGERPRRSCAGTAATATKTSST